MPRRFRWKSIRASLRSTTFANVLASAALVLSAMSAWFTYSQASSAQEANDISRQQQASDVYIEILNPLAPTPDFAIVNRSSKPVVDAYYTFKVGNSVNAATVDVGLLPGCSSVPMTPNGSNNERVGFEPVSLYYRDANGFFWQRDYGKGLTQLTNGHTVPSSGTIATDVIQLPDCP